MMQQIGFNIYDVINLIDKYNSYTNQAGYFTASVLDLYELLCH